MMNNRYSFSSWAFCEHLPDGSYKFLTPDMENVELLRRAGELVRRANAYAEAVELLRRCFDICTHPMATKDAMRRIALDASDFLAKVDNA